jgi:hypothetical protein
VVFPLEAVTNRINHNQRHHHDDGTNRYDIENLKSLGGECISHAPANTGTSRHRRSHAFFAAWIFEGDAACPTNADFLTLITVFKLPDTAELRLASVRASLVHF